MTAEGPYPRLLRMPQVRQLLVSSVVGRIPVGLSTLALILFLQSRLESLADAGIAGACHVLGLAVATPLIGRAVDRFGPQPVLVGCIVLYPAALGMLLAITLMHVSYPWVFAAALTAGGSLPPITVCVRALYPRLVADASLQRAAYSLDSAIIEVVFILGPALAAGFAAIGVSAGAVLLSAASAAAGGILFLRTGAVRAWRPRARGSDRSKGSPLWTTRLCGLLAAGLLFALAIGLFEIAIVGRTAENGVPAAAGVILALASAGSVLGVLAYGGRSWGLDPGRQFLVLLVLMAFGLGIVALAENLKLLAIAVPFAAAPMAPVIASNSVLISRCAPRDRIAEAFTWASTALLTGISGGTAAGGMLAERYSPTITLLAAASATLAAAAVAYPMVTPGGMRERNDR
jgi:predicted MFS family arabinose efflux permease